MTICDFRFLLHNRLLVKRERATDTEEILGLQIYEQRDIYIEGLGGADSELWPCGPGEGGGFIYRRIMAFNNTEIFI